MRKIPATGPRQNGADHVVRLPDGRSIGYAEYGDPCGSVIVSAHGGLACRLDVAAAADVARQTGVRLISPDRPGIGLSDPQPGRTMAQWARDVGDLTEALGIGRFAAMGWSMGGQYAATLAHELPDRVSRLAVIAGALPLTEPGVFDQLPAMDRVYTRLSQRVPLLARAGFRVTWLLARSSPGLYGRVAAHVLGPADAAVLRTEGFATFAHMSAEALRRPAGVVEDYRAWIRPWGFAPEDLTVETDIWAGVDDRLVDPHWSLQLASRIPGATLELREGGHFLAHRHYREIFESLLGHAPTELHRNSRGRSR